jgi:hypothetical protein
MGVLTKLGVPNGLITDFYPGTASPRFRKEEMKGQFGDSWPKALRKLYQDIFMVSPGLVNVEVHS